MSVYFCLIEDEQLPVVAVLIALIVVPVVKHLALKSYFD